MPIIGLFCRSRLENKCVTVCAAQLRGSAWQRSKTEGQEEEREAMGYEKPLNHLYTEWSYTEIIFCCLFAA